MVYELMEKKHQRTKAACVSKNMSQRISAWQPFPQAGNFVGGPVKLAQSILYANKRRLNTLQSIQSQPNQAWFLLQLQETKKCKLNVAERSYSIT